MKKTNERNHYTMNDRHITKRIYGKSVNERIESPLVLIKMGKYPINIEYSS